MKKEIFEPKDVTATLINRVHRTGITMMTTINKAQNKAENINPKEIEDLEVDYLFANAELENMLKSQLAQKNVASWKLFVDSVKKLRNGEKPIFQGVVRSVKKTAENIIAGRPDPFAIGIFELPPYITPYQPIDPSSGDPDFWKSVFNEAEKLETSTRDIGTNLVDAAALATAAFVGGSTAAVTGSFAAGYHIGEAINEYMGWKN